MALSTVSLSPSTASTSGYSDAAETSDLHERPASRLVARSGELDDDQMSEDSGEVDGELSKAEQLRSWVRRLRRTFGTSFLLLVSTVYAVQGFASFRSLAVNYFFKDNLQSQPAETQSLLTVMMFPWSTKPLYGVISDSFPLFGYHRKSYMIMFSTMGVIASLTLAMPHLVTTPASAVLMLTLNSLSTAVIDVVIDARVVEMSRLDPKNGANDLQSLSWGSLSVSGMLGSFLSGPATHNLGVRGVFCFAAVGLLLVLIFSILMHEPKTTSANKHSFAMARRQFALLKGAVRLPIIWKCALWVFLAGSISPGYSQVFFYFTTRPV